MLPVGCTGTYAGKMVIGADLTTDFIKADSSEVDHYEETACVKCSNAHTSFKTLDNFKLIQKRDCTAALTTIDTTTTKHYAYNVALTSTAVYTSSEAFTNAQTLTPNTGCPLTCTLKYPDCSTALSTNPLHKGSKISLSSSSPWTIHLS